MKQYEMVDAFIISTGRNTIGSKFTKADLRDWLRDEIDEWYTEAGSVLQAHRKSPEDREFTTKRIGMGPDSKYEVVATSEGMRPKATEEMHRQNGQEAMDRWFNEAIYRMYPMAKKNKKAVRIIKRAKAEVTLVSEVLQARLRELDLSDLDDKEDE